MEKLNSKLFMENYCIMQENERLRKACELLNQENQVLLTQLKQRLASGAASSTSTSGGGFPDLNASTSTASKPSKCGKKSKK